MKPKSIIIFLAILLVIPLHKHIFPQEIQFEQHIITDTFTEGFDVSSADINHDGLPDILGCGKANGGEVCWWRNNGDNTFTPYSLKQGFTGARSIRAGDLDGDNETDLVCAAWQANKIIYFENNGDESFTESEVDGNFIGAHTVDLKDLNGDGKLDILCSGFDYYGHNGEIAWWENDGLVPVGWVKHLISDRFQQSPFIFGEDMDNDFDIDIIACGELNDEILWWENDGNGQFISENMVDSLFDAAHTVIARDVDLDGDMDILGAACMSSKLAWYENNGLQEFVKHPLPQLGGDLWLDAADLDNDGDIDLFAAGMSASKLYWFENDGFQQFTKWPIDGTFTQGFSIVPINMDSDADMDLLAIGKASNTISWFENDLDSLTGIAQQEILIQNELILCPNPSNGTFTLRSNIVIDDKLTLTVFNISGAQLCQLALPCTIPFESITIDLSFLPKGWYPVKMIYKKKVHFNKLIIN